MPAAPLAARTWPPAASHCSCALSSCPLDRTGSSPVQGCWWSAARKHLAVRHRHAGCGVRLNAAQQRSCACELPSSSHTAGRPRHAQCRARLLAAQQRSGGGAALTCRHRGATAFTQASSHVGQLHSASAHGVPLLKISSGQLAVFAAERCIVFCLGGARLTEVRPEVSKDHMLWVAQKRNTCFESLRSLDMFWVCTAQCNDWYPGGLQQ